MSKVFSGGGGGGRMNSKSKGMDTANLRQPIQTTTVTGLKQALHVLSTGSSEVKNTLTNEVNLIYECKVCFSLFRSIANLIAHKRQFCKLKTAGVFHVNSDEGSGGADDATTTVVIQPEDPEPKISCTWNLHNHSPSMELIQTAGILEDILASKQNISCDPNKSILAVTKNIKAKAEAAQEMAYSTLKSQSSLETAVVANTVVLEPVFDNTNIVHQSWKVKSDEKTIKEYQDEIGMGERNKNHIIVIQADDADSKPSHQCAPPSTTANDSSGKKPFPCLKCDLSYCSIDSVRRHLMGRHDMTAEQFNKIREKFYNKRSSFSKNNSATNQCKPDVSKVQTRFPVKNFDVRLNKKDVDQKYVKELLLTSPPVDRTSEQCDKLPPEVEKRIMQDINRRHVQCKICYKKFRSTVLAQQHVAGVHLEFHRFLCTVCGYGSWVKDRVIKHAKDTHRRTNKDVVKEQSVEDYFIEPMPSRSPSPKKLSKPMKKQVETRLSPVKMLHENLIHLDMKEKSPSTCSEKENEPDIVGMELNTLEDQIRLSVDQDDDGGGGIVDVFRDKSPGVVCSLRPKRKRSDASDSSRSDSSSIVPPSRSKREKGSDSPQLLIDTRERRILSPTFSKDEKMSVCKDLKFGKDESATRSPKQDQKKLRTKNVHENSNTTKNRNPSK